MAINSFQDQYDEVTSLLESYIQKTSNFLNTLEAMARSLSVPKITYTPSIPDVFIAPIVPEEVPTAPSVGTVRDFVPGNVPNSEFLEDILKGLGSVSLIDPPTQPSLEIPEAPSVSSFTLPEEPFIETITVPDPPKISFPEDPEMIPVSIPSPPAINYPTPPNTDLPSLSEYGLDKLPNIDDVKKAIQDALETVLKIAPDITKEELNEIKFFLRDRSVAQDKAVMPQDVLNELITQYRERLQRLLNDESERVLSIWTSRGFQLPSGIVEKRLRTTIDEFYTKRWDAERELLKLQFDMTREDLKNYTSEYIKFMEFYSEFFVKVASLVIDANKSMYDMEAKVYDILIALYKIAADNIKDRIAVYTAMLEAEKAKIDIYKGELESQSLVASLNESQVKVYQAKVAAIETLYSCYSAEIKAKSLIVELDKAKIDLYRSKLDGLLALTKLDELKIQLYSAKLKGQGLLVDMYNTQMQAWKSKIDAYMKSIEIQLGKAEAAAKIYDSKIRAFVALEESKRYSVQSDVESRRLLLEVFREEILRFKHSLDGRIAEADLQKEVVRMNLNKMVEEAKITSANLEANLRAMTEISRARAQVASSGASISGTVLASALNSLNAIVNLVENIIRTASQ